MVKIFLLLKADKTWRDQYPSAYGMSAVSTRAKCMKQAVGQRRKFAPDTTLFGVDNAGNVRRCKFEYIATCSSLPSSQGEL